MFLPNSCQWPAVLSGFFMFETGVVFELLCLKLVKNSALFWWLHACTIVVRCMLGSKQRFNTVSNIRKKRMRSMISHFNIFSSNSKRSQHPEELGPKRASKVFLPNSCQWPAVLSGFLMFGTGVVFELLCLKLVKNSALFLVAPCLYNSGTLHAGLEATFQHSFQLPEKTHAFHNFPLQNIFIKFKTQPTSRRTRS